MGAHDESPSRPVTVSCSFDESSVSMSPDIHDCSFSENSRSCDPWSTWCSAASMGDWPTDFGFLLEADIQATDECMQDESRESYDELPVDRPCVKSDATACDPVERYQSACEQVQPLRQACIFDVMAPVTPPININRRSRLFKLDSVGDSPKLARRRSRDSPRSTRKLRFSRFTSLHRHFVLKQSTPKRHRHNMASLNIVGCRSR